MKLERCVGGDCAGAADELVDGFGCPRVELQALDKGVLNAEAAVHAAACCADEDAVVDRSPRRLIKRVSGRQRSRALGTE